MRLDGTCIQSKSLGKHFRKQEEEELERRVSRLRSSESELERKGRCEKGKEVK